MPLAGASVTFEPVTYTLTSGCSVISSTGTGTVSVSVVTASSSTRPARRSRYRCHMDWAAPARPVGSLSRVNVTPAPARNRLNPRLCPKSPNKPATCGPTKNVPAYSRTAAATEPEIDPSPPMTGMAMMAMETSAVKCRGVTDFQASAHSTPATPAKKPETARIDSFTVAGVAPNAALARSLSRTATNSRPGFDRRRATAVATASTSTARAT